MIYPATIGIVGGGQLGKMLALAAKKLGFFVIVTDPTPRSPAGQVADYQIIGDYKDVKATEELSKKVDFITVEAEFVNTDTLQKIKKSGTPVHPSPKIIKIIKDKLKQKKFLNKNNIPTAKYISVNSEQDIENAIEMFGWPLLLKAREDAYDGKGNYVLRKRADIALGFKKLQDRKLYVEKYVYFKKEIAVMIARNKKGDMVVYPVVETIHKNNICDTVIYPALISKNATKSAQNLAKKTVKKLNGVGVFGIEMFLLKNDNVLINEIAPRVHNSGHLTIEASVTSQFEQHIRAITGLPLGSTNSKVKSAVMKNILGEREGSCFPKGLDKTLKVPGVSYHFYNKKESRINRKMGHITVVGDSSKLCLKRAARARKALVI